MWAAMLGAAGCRLAMWGSPGSVLPTGTLQEVRGEQQESGRTCADDPDCGNLCVQRWCPRGGQSAPCPKPGALEFQGVPCGRATPLAYLCPQLSVPPGLPMGSSDCFILKPWARPGLCNHRGRPSLPLGRGGQHHLFVGLEGNSFC